MAETVDRSWRAIPGTGDEFFVADDGTVRGPSGDVAPIPNKHGRLLVVVKGRKRRLAQLVLEAFEPEQQPGCRWLIHRDGDFANCRRANLAWVSETAYREHQQETRGVDPWKQRVRARKRELEFVAICRAVPAPGKGRPVYMGRPPMEEAEE